MTSPFHDPDSVTIKNLETAFAGESMAHIKYRYFAKLCRAMGDESTARVFEETAEQEILHAFSHADLLFPPSLMTPEIALELAIAGETYEYTEMYPTFRIAALAESRSEEALEMETQIEEAKEHAEIFKAALKTAAKRFGALSKVEAGHANRYQETLSKLRVL